MTIFSLPREIRDQIYKLLLVSSQPVSFQPSKGFVCVEDEQQKCLALMNHASNPFDIEGAALLGLVSSGPSAAKEAREIFYRHNTFEVTGERLERFLEFVPFQQGPDLPSACTSWVGNLVIEDADGSQPYLDRLLSCPKLRNVEIKIYGLPTGFSKVSVNIMKVTNACIKLNAKLGMGFKLTVNMVTSDSDSDEAEDIWDCRLLSSTDLSWLFRPDLVLACRCDERDHSNVTLKKLIPLQLATMSIFIEDYRKRDQTQDQTVKRIILTALTEEAEANAEAKGSRRRPYVISWTLNETYVYSSAWGCNESAGLWLEKWLHYHALRDENGRLAPFLPDYPLVMPRHHQWA